MQKGDSLKVDFKATWGHMNHNYVLTAQDIFILTVLASISLLFPCKEGAEMST